MQRILSQALNNTRLIGLIGLIALSLFSLQALNDGQHPPTGTGAGVPSRQILRSMVQKTLAQFG